jgi:hypothetical protein
MKKKVIALCGVFTVLVLVTLSILFSRTSKEGVDYYTMEGNALYGAGKRYVTGATEFPLQPTQVGRTIGQSKDRGFKVYELPGDSSHNWVVVKGLMFDGVYRDEGVSPINPSKLKVQQIQLTPSVGGSPPPLRTSKDPEMIGDLRNTLDSVNSSSNSPSLNSQNDVYIIRMIAPELNGLVYWIYGTVDKTGKVYISNPGFQTLIPADKKLGSFISGK